MFVENNYSKLAAYFSIPLLEKKLFNFHQNQLRHKLKMQ